MLTSDTKLTVVRALEKGASRRNVIEQFSVSKSTISDIWKDRQKFMDNVASSESLVCAKKQCIVRKVKYDLIDSACWNELVLPAVVKGSASVRSSSPGEIEVIFSMALSRR